MTINHLFLPVSPAHFAAMRVFYSKATAPVGYKEMLFPQEGLVGFGSDFPYFWLSQTTEGQSPVPTHICFDAPSDDAVDEFWKAALEAGGQDNGKPDVRGEEFGRPHYAAFVLDPQGNNIEAVTVDKTKAVSGV